MKRIRALFPAFGLMALCSCSLNPSFSSSESKGDPISREDAYRILDESKAYVENDSYLFPTKGRIDHHRKNVHDGSDLANPAEEESQEAILYDWEARCSFQSIDYSSRNERGEVNQYSAYQWMFTQNGIFYCAQSDSLEDFSNASYREMGEQEFWLALQRQCFFKQQAVNYLESSKDSWSNRIQEMERSATPFTESYFSSGEGDLEASFSYSGPMVSTINGEKWNGTSSGEHVIKIRDHLPVFETLSHEIRQEKGEEWELSSGEDSTTLTFGSISFQAPDLSRFQKEE